VSVHCAISITGTVIAIFSEAVLISITGAVIAIACFEVFPQNMYPASTLKPLFKASCWFPVTFTSATIKGS
jgi:hypothetical protein